MRRFLALTSSALTGLLVAGVLALAAPPGVINQYNSICDPGFPKRCIAVDTNGAIAVTGGSGGGGSATLKSTAADPTYVEGVTTNPLSSDLSGYMRVLAKQQTSPWVISGTVSIGGANVPVTQATNPWTISGPVTHIAGSAVDGWDITQGSKTDAKAAQTDGTALSIVSILKQLSFMLQNPASTPVTGTVGISGSVAATQSGAWNVGQTGAPWSVTGSGSAGTPASGVVSVQGIAGATALPVSQSGTWTVQQGTPPWGITITPSSSAAVGIAPVVSTALETGHVLKAGAGNLYGVEVTTTSVAGYLLVFNATAVPAAGAVSPVAHCYVAAFGTCGLDFDPPLALATGISVAFSASTTPFTKTDSATAAFSGQVQ